MADLVILFYSLILTVTLYLSLKYYNFITIIPLTIIYMIVEIPFLLTAYYTPDILYPVSLAWVDDFDYVFIQHILLRLIFLICFIGISLACKPRNPNINSSRIKAKKSHLVIVLLLLLFSYFSFLNQVGGLPLLLMNLNNKTELIKGSAFFRLTFVYSTFLFSSLYVRYLSQSKGHSRIVFFMCMLLMFLMLASYGERKSAVVLLLVIALCWHLMIKPINLASGKILASFLFILFFAALAPPLRDVGSFDRYMLDPSQLLVDMLPHLGELFRRFSDIDISIFVFSYFKDADNFWYLSTLDNFFIGFLPSNLYHGKPPLDEGVIIYNLAHGNAPAIDASFEEYFPVGWPLSRYTSGWVHFGYLGVGVYSVITSWFLIKLNNLTFKRLSVYFLPLYVTAVVSGFSLSNASVFNFLTACFVILMSFILIKVYDALFSELF